MTLLCLTVLLHLDKVDKASAVMTECLCQLNLIIISIVVTALFNIRLSEDAPKIILGALLSRTLDIKVARLVLIFKLQH